MRKFDKPAAFDENQRVKNPPRHLSACVLAAVAAHAVLVAAVMLAPASAHRGNDTVQTCLVCFVPPPPEQAVEPVLPPLTTPAVNAPESSPRVATGSAATAHPNFEPTFATSARLSPGPDVMTTGVVLPSPPTTGISTVSSSAAAAGLPSVSATDTLEISRVAEEAAELTRALPAYRSNPKPAYPVTARLRRHEGVVQLGVDVSADGEATRVAVEKSSGHASLDAAARDAVWQWRFDPARLGDARIPSRVEVSLRFRLGD